MNNVEKLTKKNSEEVKDTVSDVAIETNVAEKSDNVTAEAQQLACVTCIVHKAEDNSASAKLKIFNNVTKDFDKENWDLVDVGSKAFVRSLIKKGFTRKDAKTLSESVQRNVRTILELNDRNMIKEAHSALGWFQTKKAMVFKADKIYSAEGTVESDYIGSRSIVSNGNLETYRKMLIECVVGQDSLEAVCSMGASSTVLPFANAVWGTSIDNTINHMTGTSSTGKSTAASLFVSFGSAPIGKGSLTLTFLSTDNALLAQVAGIFGYPVAIDELSTAGRKKLTNVVYALTDGTGKVRCIAGGSGLTGDDRFSTVFLSGGETGLRKKCEKLEGITVRVFEYSNVEWTRNAAEAAQIKAVAKANFGLVTPRVAKELLENGEAWHSKFILWQERISERIASEKLILGTADRLTDIVAVYMTSCQIFNAVMQVELDVEAVFDFFFLHIIFKNASDANIGIRAHEAILQHFRRYKDDRYDDADAVVLMPVDGKTRNYMMSQNAEGLVETASKLYEDKKGNTYNSCIMFPMDVLDLNFAI